MICVDSSVVVKLVVKEEDSEMARGLFRVLATRNEDIIAPQFLMMEVSNVLLKKTRRQPAISINTANSALSTVLNLGISLHDSDSLHHNAFRIAVSHRLPAVYDAYYLALAADAQCPFWTADKRLYNGLDGRLPFVHWLGDFRG